MKNFCDRGAPPVAAGDRCTGECCKVFHLPWSHTEWAAILNGTSAIDAKYDFDEIAMIVSMVRPLPMLGPHQYTCSLFDGHNCTAYEARPSMCRRYPYGLPCEHGHACAWDLGRRGAHGGTRTHLPILRAVG